MQCQGCGKDFPLEEIVTLYGIQYGERCLECAHDHIFGELGTLVYHVHDYAEKATPEQKANVIDGLLQLIGEAR